MEAMLRLRQELLLTQMLSKPKNTSGADAGDGFMGLLSQDLVGPGSLKDQLNSDMDSGCGTENNKETLQPTQDSAEPPSAQPAFPPVNTMAPQIPFSSLCELSPRGKAMLLCMQFLQSLCWLNRVEGEVMGAEAGGLSLDRGGDGDRLVVEDSVCQLLSCVMAASRDARALPPHSLLLQVSLVAAQAVDHLLSHRQPSLKFVAHMEDALKELTELLLCNDQLNRFQVEERLTECLTLLGGNSLLRSLLIRHVLSEINRLAEHVWITCQILKRFYSCTIESILTGCITAWYGNCSASDRKALQRVVRTAQYITGAKLPAIQDLYTRRYQRKAIKIQGLQPH
ncbi:meiosis-specific protein MEI4-like isoform 2-T2 [Salvelinus alpinus]